MAHAFALTRRRLVGISLATAVLPGALRAQGAREIVQMAKGAADAPVTMIEYASLTCPHCAAFHTEVLPQIEANYIEPGQVRLIYREVYFDRPGLWAAMMARCAGPDRYFGVIDLLYRAQDEWGRAEDPQVILDGLHAIGRQAGMSDGDIDACLQDAEFAKALVAEYQRNVAADGIDSTPTFLIDGAKTTNMPYEGFVTALDTALGV